MLCFKRFTLTSRLNFILKTVIKLIILILGLISGIYLQMINPPIFIELKENIKGLKIKYFKKDIGFESCELEETFLKELNELDENILIIGHAYSLLDKGNSIDTSILVKKLKKDLYKIRKIIFTGDIFENPSLNKWQELIKFFDERNIEMHISPGNHDVGFGDNSKRDIFLDVFDKQYPYFEEISSNTLGVFTDTNQNGWKLKKDYLSLEANDEVKRLFLFSHHVLRPHAEEISNSVEGKPINLEPFYNFNILKKYSDDFDEVVSFSGDTGAFEYLPSIECLEKGNIKFISSGIGVRETNKILVLVNDELFQIKI